MMTKPVPTKDYVKWFRNSAPYINAHRGKTFVLMFSGEAVARESQLREAGENLRQTSDRRDAALVEQGVLEQHISRCDELTHEISGKERERDRLSDEAGMYDELARAFGRNGIQALIIESAIPQLETDANELLARLTENRMHLRLQLLEGRKESRTGLPSEELDIKIAEPQFRALANRRSRHTSQNQRREEEIVESGSFHHLPGRIR